MMDSESDESDNNLEHEEFEAGNIPALLPAVDDRNEFVIQGLNIGHVAQPDVVFVDSDDDDLDEQLDSNSENNDDNDGNVSSADDASGLSGENEEDESDASGDQSPHQIPNFDRQLPTRHTYLGDGMEPLTGRSFYDDDTIIETPIIVLDIMLVPGQTLPLSEFHYARIGALKRCINSDKMFGTVKNPYREFEHREIAAAEAIHGLNIVTPGMIGTMAEIYEYSEEGEIPIVGGFNFPPTFSIKAKGRQRFEVLSVRKQLDGNLVGTIRIRAEKKFRHLLTHVESHGTSRYINPIPPIKPGVVHALNPVVWNDLNLTSAIEPKLLSLSPREDKVLNVPTKRKRNHYSVMTQWPSFVYDAYDEANLVKKVQKKVTEEFKTKLINNIPSDPTELSFWVAQNLTLGDTYRENILKIDSTIQRLIYILELLDKVDRFIDCRQCGETVADQQDIFCMSVEGPQGTYVNPGGFVHETLTVKRAKELITQGRNYSTEACWFPGYSWKIIICCRCHLHLGWKFRSVGRLNPPKFYGLTRKNVIFKYRLDEDGKKVPREDLYYSESNDED